MRPFECAHGVRSSRRHVARTVRPPRVERSTTSVWTRRRLHITEYFDPTSDELGVVEMRCAVLGGLFDLLDDDEARWAATGVMGALNNAVTTASATYGWTYVGGIAAAFARHGYCSTDPWVVGIAESRLRQGNTDGAFHPNGAGHAAYAQALFGSLRSALLLPAPVGGGTAVGADLLGDLVVTTSTRCPSSRTALRDTGSGPGVLGSWVVDRIVSGAGGLYSFGPAAIDRNVAVGVWTQLPINGQTITQEYGAQLAVRPNAAVRAVSVVQAPTGWSIPRGQPRCARLRDDRCCDRPARRPAGDRRGRDVAFRPRRPGRAPGRPIVAATTTSIRMRPGINKVLLPTDQPFRLAPGERVSATVTVDDPPGASPADDVDNTLSTDDSVAKEAVETRPLTIEFMATTTSLGQVGCSDLSEIARRQIGFAKAAMPLAGAGVLPLLSCGELYRVDGNERGDPALPERARLVGPPFTGRRHGRGGTERLARASRRRRRRCRCTRPPRRAHRAVGACDDTGARGGAHVRHRSSDRGPRASTGARIDSAPSPRRDQLDGHAHAGEGLDRRRHVGRPRRPNRSARWGAGSARSPVTRSGDHRLGDQHAAPICRGNGLPERPAARGPTSTTSNSRAMLVEQMDGTDVVASEPIPLQRVGGLYSADTIRGVVDRVRLHRSDHVAVRRDQRCGSCSTATWSRSVRSPPFRTSPSRHRRPGSSVRRGDPITVTWSTAAPIGVDATATVLISQDGGGTWKPLATGLTGSPAVLTAPADLTNGAAIVRVVVTDGVRSGHGDSGVFDIGVPEQLLPERVVAVRSDLIDLTVPGPRCRRNRGRGSGR